MARRDMPGLRALQALGSTSQPFRDLQVLGCVTPTPETGAFILTLASLGASIRWCSDNRFAADEDVVAYLNAQGLPVFARANMSLTEYFDCMNLACRFPADSGQQIHIIDDGADLTDYLCQDRPQYFEKVRGITEQTTCGVARIRRLYEEHKLPVPTISINDCFTKKYFDNHYGIQESIVHTLIRSTGIQLRGKNVCVFGYGPVGQGAATILRSLGAKVSIVEADLLRLMQAHFDGFAVDDPKTALAHSHICITATGCVDTVSAEMLENARDGIILCNVGHGTAEYDAEHLRKAPRTEQVNDFLEAHHLASGRVIYSLCKGALANLVVAGGNPPAIMSLTFTLQALGHLEFLRHPGHYCQPRLYRLPRQVEVECARLNYPAFAEKLYVLTPHQSEYLGLDDDRGPTAQVSTR